MNKKTHMKVIKLFPAIAGVILSCFGLVMYPQQTAQGIKNGLALLAENIIPSLFPFMVLSTYISNSVFVEFLAKLFEKPAQKIFKTNGNAVIAVILGFIGGYPIGAKTAYEFYLAKKLTDNEVQRLFYWCVNPSPAFVITAVGTFMLSNYKNGIILYLSTVLSSLFIGFCARFFSNNETASYKPPHHISRKNIFLNSVSVGSDAMLAICGWVLTFSAIAVLADIFAPDEYSALFIKSILEVTTGCKYATIYNLPLPLISAILGFGGFAVIFQIGTYMEKCRIPIKTFLCIRIVNSALSAFFCSQIMKLFPESTDVFSEITIGGAVFPVSHSISATLLLVLMCIVLIFEVDNKRKVC